MLLRSEEAIVALQEIGFERFKVPDGYFDAAIGGFPVELSRRPSFGPNPPAPPAVAPAPISPGAGLSWGGYTVFQSCPVMSRLSYSANRNPAMECSLAFKAKLFLSA